MKQSSTPRPTLGSASRASCWLRRSFALLALLLSVPVFGQTRYVVVSDRLTEVEHAAREKGGVVQHRLKYLKGFVVELHDPAAASLRSRFGEAAIIEPDLEYSINLPPSAPPASKGKPGGGGGGGGTPSQTIPWGITAVQYAHNRGVIMVAASGNNGCSSCTDFPAQYPEVVAVSAIDSGLQIAAFSNYGRLIEYTAPGADVLSTYRGGGYSTMSGTSMATPHVSGVVALMRSAGIDTLYAVDIGLPIEQQGNGLISAVP